MAHRKGGQKDLTKADVVVGTYAIGQTNVRLEKLPPALEAMPLVFADEGHESTTKSRLELLREHFSPAAIRLAVSGTPDYNENRQLGHFFPDLIHTMTTPEALELGLMSQK